MDSDTQAGSYTLTEGGSVQPPEQEKISQGLDALSVFDNQNKRCNGAVSETIQSQNSSNSASSLHKDVDPHEVPSQTPTSEHTSPVRDDNGSVKSERDEVHAQASKHPPPLGSSAVVPGDHSQNTYYGPVYIIDRFFANSLPSMSRGVLPSEVASSSSTDHADTSINAQDHATNNHSPQYPSNTSRAPRTATSQQPSSDWNITISVASLLTQISADVWEHAPTTKVTICPKITWADALSKALQSLEHEDRTTLIFPRKSKEEQAAVKNFVLKNPSPSVANVPSESSMSIGLPVTG